MTTITIDRATVEQALQALEEYAPQHGRPDDMMVAIAALRAALAQEQAKPLTNQCGETCERAKLCATCARELSHE